MMNKLNKLLGIVCVALLFIGCVYVIAPTIAAAVDIGIKGIIWIIFFYGSFRFCEYTIKCLYRDIYKRINK